MQYSSTYTCTRARVVQYSSSRVLEYVPRYCYTAPSAAVVVAVVRVVAVAAAAVVGVAGGGGGSGVGGGGGGGGGSGEGGGDGGDIDAGTDSAEDLSLPDSVDADSEGSLTRFAPQHLCACVRCSFGLILQYSSTQVRTRVRGSRSR
jgi:hypothetical protein